MELNRLIPEFDVDQLVWCIDHKWISILKKVPANQTSHTLLKKLLLSVNPLDGNDTAPFGLRMSIDFQSADAQTILNVKRFIKKERIHKNLKRGPITPKIDITCLYDHPSFVWIRCELFSNTSPDQINLEDLPFEYYHQFNTTTVEFYFRAKPKSKTAAILEAFNSSIHVKHITFFSGCKNLRPDKYASSLVLSNLIKFYYCESTKKLTFSANSTNDYHSLLRHLAACVLYLYRNSLKRYNANSNYNESIFSVMSGTSSTQVMKNMTTNTEMQLCTSRDFQAFNLPVCVGGANTSEMIIPIDL